jgi:hypothetical protein
LYYLFVWLLLLFRILNYDLPILAIVITITCMSFSIQTTVNCQVYRVWQVVKTPTIISNIPVYIYRRFGTTVRIYHYTLRNSPVERSSHLLRGGSLKSRVSRLHMVINRLATGKKSSFPGYTARYVCVCVCVYGVCVCVCVVCVCVYRFLSNFIFFVSNTLKRPLFD